eukprot:CAMPEP_0114303924 /NCGR_PEP_ID=MMETSP0059-20121206/15495_1 /TAXON_ID=36894 /ORGANISM="Pyramimonas parkeae, Strain CCMP726" /LENGTH=149 /DNA_ID=CAMNT_0001426953 /DNA_START=465 /DNA_END=910 /DNA_ORIENTATION=+
MRGLISNQMLLAVHHEILNIHASSMYLILQLKVQANVADAFGGNVYAEGFDTRYRKVASIQTGTVAANDHFLKANYTLLRTWKHDTNTLASGITILLATTRGRAPTEISDYHVYVLAENILGLDTLKCLGKDNAYTAADLMTSCTASLV